MLAVLLGAQLAAWATRPAPTPPAPVPIERVPMRVGHWRGTDLGPFDRVTMDMLKPDAYLNREYLSAEGLRAHLAVICGHQKSTFHSPGFCLLGGGWNIVSKSRVSFQPPGASAVTANRFLLVREGRHAVVLYYYLQGNRATPSWVVHQAYLVMDRLHRSNPGGALVRLTLPAAADGAAATERGLGLLRDLHPHLLKTLGA